MKACQISPCSLKIINYRQVRFVKGSLRQMACVERNPFKGSAKAKFRQLCFLKAIVERVQSFLSSVPAYEVVLKALESQQVHYLQVRYVAGES